MGEQDSVDRGAGDMRQTSNDIKNIIEGWTEGQLENVYTAMPGTVESFNPATNRASVKPCGNYKATDGRDFPYPVIYNAPVYFPCGMGGKAGMTFPVKQGDGCLIVFSKEQLEDFLSGGKSDSIDPRQHSMNDAIVLPGLYSNAVPASSQHPDDVCLFKGSALLQLNENEFKGQVGGTNFRFAGGDLVVNGISLVHHVHSGVTSGASNTGQPVR